MNPLTQLAILCAVEEKNRRANMERVMEFRIENDGSVYAYVKIGGHLYRAYAWLTPPSSESMPDIGPGDDGHSVEEYIKTHWEKVK